METMTLWFVQVYSSGRWTVAYQGGPFYEQAAANYREDQLLESALQPLYQECAKPEEIAQVHRTFRVIQVDLPFSVVRGGDL